MKKVLFTAAIAAGVVGLSAGAFASDGDLEITGHVNAGMGWQSFSSNASALSSGNAGLAANAGSVGGAFRGPIGDLTLNDTVGTKEQEFIFFVDEAEVDFKKSFGENINVRADVAFGAAAIGSTVAGVNLEQAYATINIPAGNGIEFLIGRFDLPIGFESVERGENTLFSHGNIFRYLRPAVSTGIKFYYPFSDMVDLHVYVVNNLRDALGSGAVEDVLLPSFGFRTGINWGDEGKKSTVGISAAGGSELNDGTKMGNYTYLGDLDWNVWIGENFAIGGEAIYRNDNATSGATKARYLAGQLNFHYVFTDTWDGTLRYGFAQDKAGVGATALAAGALLSSTGGKTTNHELTAGVQYHLDDNAKIQFEGRYDLVKSNAAGFGTGHVYGAALNFAYNF